MIKELTKEQKDRLFERLIVSASDILSEELNLPKRSFEELQALFEEPTKTEDNLLDLFVDPKHETT